MKNLRFGLIVLLTAFALVLAGCGAKSAEVPKGDAGGKPGSAKDTITYALQASPVGVFHPTLQYSNHDRAVLFLIFDRLLVKDGQGKYVPSLAASYEISPDGKTYTFKLKKGIKWHDGKDFTAEDVAFTYETTCHPKFGKGYDEFSSNLLGADAYHEGKAKNVEGVKVIDPQTVSFTFKEAYNAALVKFIDKPVFAKHIWDKVSVENWGTSTDLLRNPVGTGPYKFVKFRSRPICSAREERGILQGRSPHQELRAQGEQSRDPAVRTPGRHPGRGAHPRLEGRGP